MYVCRGRSIAVLTIQPDELEPEVEGFCRSTSDTGRAEDLIDISLAGPMAEWRAYGNESDFESFLEDHAGQLDIYEAGELARHHLAQRAPPVPAEVLRQEAAAWLVERCAGVALELDKLWPAVEAVADALLRRRRLTGDEVAAIYGEAERR